MQQTSFADGCAIANDAAGTDDGAGADGGVVSDYGMGADVDAFADHRRIGHDGRWMDARRKPLGRVEDCEGDCERRARIPDADECPAGRKGLVDNQTAGLGGGGHGHALAPGGEGQVTRAGLLDRERPVQFQFAITFKCGL
jgi:hypothetical protein